MQLFLKDNQQPIHILNERPTSLMERHCKRESPLMKNLNAFDSQQHFAKQAGQSLYYPTCQKCHRNQ